VPHACMWCRRPAGRMYQLKPNEWYCVECATMRMYKAGQLPKAALLFSAEGKTEAIENELFGEYADDTEVETALKDLQTWINEFEV
jgi:hypothetical protein